MLLMEGLDTASLVEPSGTEHEGDTSVESLGKNQDSFQHTAEDDWNWDWNWNWGWSWNRHWP